MSVANVFCQGSTGYLLADRGYFHADGRLAFTGRKVLELPRYGAAIVARGHLRARDQIARGIRAARPATIAELLALMPNILLDALTGEIGKPGENAETLTTHLTIAYIHPDTGRAAGALIGSDRTGMPDWYEPFSVVPVAHATAPGVDIAAAIGRAVDPADPAGFNIEVDGLTVAEAQRRDVWSYNGIATGHHAGGGIDLTTVTPAGISTKRLRTWPDRVGEMVEMAA